MQQSLDLIIFLYYYATSKIGQKEDCEKLMNSKYNHDAEVLLCLLKN